jgi:hypothetical protein
MKLYSSVLIALLLVAALFHAPSVLVQADTIPSDPGSEEQQNGDDG